MFIIYTHLPSPKSFHQRARKTCFFHWPEKAPHQPSEEKYRLKTNRKINALSFLCSKLVGCFFHVFWLLRAFCHSRAHRCHGIHRTMECHLPCFQRWDSGATDEWPCFSSGRLASDFRPTRYPTANPRFVVHYMCGLYGWFSMEQFHAASRRLPIP